MSKHHEASVGLSDEWYTPVEIFHALRLVFDLDPCSPGEGHWVPAKKIYTKQDDGLSKPWHGAVFMNPPFGGRNGVVPWLKKFIAHGQGIAIVPARTSAGWFQDYATQAQVHLFPRGKTKFVRPDGSVGKSPGHGIVLLGMGFAPCYALRSSDLGWCP